MRAIQITQLTGPRSAFELVDLPEPEPTEQEPVLVEVHAAGVSFPEVLQSRGLYQIKPDLPFVPGSEVGGIVRSAPAGAPVKPGDRVAAFTLLGAFAERATAPSHFTLPLHPKLDFAQGAGLILNYHTAYFALVMRGRLSGGERVLVQGAAGGVGTAAIQVAKGLGAHVTAVVSSDEKAQIAKQAGADRVLRTDEAWPRKSTDVVIDPVGGDRFLDSLRTLDEGGRHVVVGFTGGSIPEVRVNRLLLNNTEVVGAGWGGHVLTRPEVTARIAAELDRLIDAGAVAPIVGARYPLEQASDAVTLLDERRALGKVVLEVDPCPG